MFPTAHCYTPGSYAGFTSAGVQQRAAFQEKTKARRTPGSDLVRRALVYGGNWLYVIFLPQRIALPLVCLSTYRQWNPSG